MNDRQTPDPDAKLISLLQTEDLGLLMLASKVLDEAEIAHTVMHGDRFDPLNALRPTLNLGGIQGVAELTVSDADEARARALLVDLLPPSSRFGDPTVAAAAAPAPPDPPTGPDIHLSDADTGVPLGMITESQLRDLVDLLEEDATSSQTYYVDAATIEMLRNAAADAELISELERALASRDGIDIRWARR